MYEFLNKHHYFWDRKDANHIWVALNGYKIFNELYDALMEAAEANRFIHMASDFDKHSGKTFYTFKHR